MTLTAPLVGMFHHRPAVALLRHLPVDAPLVLRLEPQNHYDPNAVMVLLRSQDIPAQAHDALNLDLAGFGFDLPEVLAKEEWHLGYVARNFAPAFTQKIMDNILTLDIAAAEDLGEDLPTQVTVGDWPGLLGFDVAGKPTVTLSE
jgi:hypothetical protein